ncbi:hypothetical protein BH11PSE2_BH11PSE2_14070 [soil metagenome]
MAQLRLFLTAGAAALCLYGCEEKPNFTPSDAPLPACPKSATPACPTPDLSAFKPKPAASSPKAGAKTVVAKAASNRQVSVKSSRKTVVVSRKSHVSRYARVRTGGASSSQTYERIYTSPAPPAGYSRTYTYEERSDDARLKGAPPPRDQYSERRSYSESDRGYSDRESSDLRRRYAQDGEGETRRYEDRGSARSKSRSGGSSSYSYSESSRESGSSYSEGYDSRDSAAWRRSHPSSQAPEGYRRGGQDDRGFLTWPGKVEY